MSRKNKRGKELTRRASKQMMEQGYPLPPNVTGRIQVQQQKQMAMQQQQSLAMPPYSPTQMYQAQQQLRQPYTNNRQPNGLPPGTPQIDPNLLANMGVIPTEQYEQFMYNQNIDDYAQTMFAPGAPLVNVPGLETPKGPRQWDYPSAYNIASLPRSNELMTFDQLRELASFEGVRLCERVWFDVLNRLRLKVTFEDGIIPPGENDQDPQWAEIIKPAYDFLMCPDFEHTINEWLIASVGDVLEIGQSAIFINRNRKGKIISLDLIDASTLKPLLTGRGTLPRPPKPAYQQFIKGVPAGLYLGQLHGDSDLGYVEEKKMQALTTSNIWMVREMAKTNSPYARSRVEDIVMSINTAIRLNILNLTQYTDGAVPAGFITTDADNPLFDDIDKVEEYERRLNAVLGGSDQQRMRLKILPAGLANFIATRPYDSNTEFDRYLKNICAASFGVTMSELSFTETVNKSSGETQERVVYRRVVQPTAAQYAKLLTRVVKEWDPRLIAKWEGLEELDDKETKVHILDVMVKDGAISPSDMAREMGVNPKEEVPAYIIAGDTVVLVKDIASMSANAVQAATTKNQTASETLKTQQMQNQMYSQQLNPAQETGANENVNQSINPQAEEGEQTEQGGKQGQGKNAEEESGNSEEGNAEGGAARSGGNGQQAEQQSKSEQQAAEKQVDQLINEAKANQKNKTRSIDIEFPQALNSSDILAQIQRVSQTLGKDSFGGNVNIVGSQSMVIVDEDPRAKIKEWERYKTVATRCVKNGEPVKAFSSEIIPADELSWVATRLKNVKTPDDVRAVFLASKEHVKDCKCSICLPTTQRCDEEHTGVMVAFMMPLNIANQLAIPGYEKPEDMHITLVYCGDTSEMEIDKIKLVSLVREWALNEKPITVDLTTVEMFNPAEGDKPLVLRSFTEALYDLRARLFDALIMGDAPVNTKFPQYKAHMTLAYIPDGEVIPNVQIPDNCISVTFNAVTVAYCNERIDIPLGG